jgi:hypothetical protein
MARLYINCWLPEGDTETVSCRNNITREIMIGRSVENEEPPKADRAKRRQLRLLNSQQKELELRT